MNDARSMRLARNRRAYGLRMKTMRQRLITECSTYLTPDDMQAALRAAVRMCENPELIADLEELARWLREGDTTE